MLTAQVRPREAREAARRHPHHHRPAAARPESPARAAGRALGAALPGVHPRRPRALRADLHGPARHVPALRPDDRPRRDPPPPDRRAAREAPRQRGPQAAHRRPLDPAARAGRASRAAQAPAPAVPRRPRAGVRRPHAAAHGHRARPLAGGRRGGGPPEGAGPHHGGHPPGRPRRRRPRDAQTLARAHRRHARLPLRRPAPVGPRHGARARAAAAAPGGRGRFAAALRPRR